MDEFEATPRVYYGAEGVTNPAFISTTGLDEPAGAVGKQAAAIIVHEIVSLK